MRYFGKSIPAVGTASAEALCVEEMDSVQEAGVGWAGGLRREQGGARPGGGRWSPKCDPLLSNGTLQRSLQVARGKSVLGEHRWERGTLSGAGVIQEVTVLGWVLVMEGGWQGWVGT